VARGNSNETITLLIPAAERIIRSAASGPRAACGISCSEKLGWLFGSLDANIYLANDVSPLLGLAQPRNKFLERLCMLRCVFEPGEKIKRFPKIIAVVKAPCDCRKILQTRFNVPRS